jgi:hypothetical protein
MVGCASAAFAPLWYWRAQDANCVDFQLDDPLGKCPRADIVDKAKLMKGRCADNGYKNANGSHTFEVKDCAVEGQDPPKMTVFIWYKTLNAPLWYWGARDGKCADIQMDDKVGTCARADIVDHAKLSKGRCADQGYTNANGSHTFEVKQCGDPPPSLTIFLWYKSLIASVAHNWYDLFPVPLTSFPPSWF